MSLARGARSLTANSLGASPSCSSLAACSGSTLLGGILCCNGIDHPPPDRNTHRPSQDRRAARGRAREAWSSELRTSGINCLAAISPRGRHCITAKRAEIERHHNMIVVVALRLRSNALPRGNISLAHVALVRLARNDEFIGEFGYVRIPVPRERIVGKAVFIAGQNVCSTVGAGARCGMNLSATALSPFKGVNVTIMRPSTVIVRTSASS